MFRRPGSAPRSGIPQDLLHGRRTGGPLDPAAEQRQIGQALALPKAITINQVTEYSVTPFDVTESQVDNPFRYGELVSGEFFTNRVEELAELEQDLGSGQNVVIISPRRFGKTSLILVVIERLRKKGVLVAYLDLFGTPTKASFTQALAKALYAGILSPYEKELRAVSDAFRGISIMPKLSLGEDGTPILELTAGRTDADLDRDLEVLLALPGKIANERGKRIVLILAVARLKEKGMIDVRRGEDYAIADTFLRFWIAKVVPKQF